MKEIIIFEKYLLNSNGIMKKISTNRILKPIYNKSNGYYSYSLEYENGLRKQFLVHRLVALHFIPNPEFKKQVNHIDGDKSNNKLSNLEWVTSQENCIHAIENKLYKTINILTKNEKENFLVDYNNGEDIDYILKKYNIKATQVFSILSRIDNNLVNRRIINKNLSNEDQTRNEKILNEFIPGYKGNFKALCEKYSLKKSQLYNIVNSKSKKLDKNKILKQYFATAQTPEDLAYIALKNEITNNCLKDILKKYHENEGIKG